MMALKSARRRVGKTKAEVPLTMEAVITRENLMLAYQRVVENKGCGGVETVAEEELAQRMAGID